MPSRFPGMDPFIENQAWEDFHTRFISAMGDALVEMLRPKYIVQVERRVYLESHDPQSSTRSFVADAAVYQSSHPGRDSTSGNGGNMALATAAEVEVFGSTVPMPIEQRECYLIIRRGREQEVVTMIELLSPANKRPESDGRKAYLDKRLELMRTRTSLVELDLLRGGARMPCDPQPPGDFYALVSRPQKRPVVEIYVWPLAHQMPVIPIPLDNPDPDARLNLQTVFNTVYDRAGYDYSLDYTLPLQPKLSASAEVWFNSLQSKNT